MFNHAYFYLFFMAILSISIIGMEEKAATNIKNRKILKVHLRMGKGELRDITIEVPDLSDTELQQIKKECIDRDEREKREKQHKDFLTNLTETNSAICSLNQALLTNLFILTENDHKNFIEKYSNALDALGIYSEIVRILSSNERREKLIQWVDQIEKENYRKSIIKKMVEITSNIISTNTLLAKEDAPFHENLGNKNFLLNKIDSTILMAHEPLSRSKKRMMAAAGVSFCFLGLIVHDYMKYSIIPIFGRQWLSDMLFIAGCSVVLYDSIKQRRQLCYQFNQLKKLKQGLYNTKV